MRWLILALSAFLIGMFSCAPAHAYGTVPKKSQVAWTKNGTTYGPTCAGACAADNAGNQYGTGYSGSQTGFTCVNSGGNATVLECRYDYTLYHNGVYSSSGNVSGGMYSQQTSPPICPAGSEQQPDGTCRCGLGLQPGAGGECVAVNCQNAADDLFIAQNGKALQGTSASTSFCHQGCAMQGGMTATGADGRIWIYPYSNTVSYRVTGTCSLTQAPNGSSNVADPQSSQPPSKCPVNQCPGQVNGADVCVACASQKTEGPSTSASGVNGTAAAGSGSSTETGTTCIGGKCTTTTTTKNAAGEVVGEETKTEDQSSFCEQNPTAPVCKASAYAEAGCGQVPTCDGDAIQCAMARRQHKDSCDLLHTETPQSQIADQAAAAGAFPADHPLVTAQAQSMDFGSRIDQSNALGSQCPQDVVISYVGTSLTLPFSRLCSSLQMLGQLLVGVAMLAAAGIVFRG